MIQTFNPSYIYPGIIDLLNALKQRGLWIALGSASKNGPKLLNLLELNDYFDYVVDPSPLLGKPNPDIFLDAMNHFHLTPEECIGFEDAEAGIEAINRAGMVSIGVGTESLKEAKFKYPSIEFIDSMELDKIIGK
jgi:beta-phosphoglucomutase